MLSVDQVQNHQIAAKQAHAFFSKRARFYDFLFFKLSPYADVVRALLVDRGVPTSNMKVLDAGTGTGLMTRTLYSLSREKGLSNIVFHAFDLTEAMLAKFGIWIQEQGAEDDISTEVQDVFHLEKLPETWNDYDLIVTACMLEYVPPESLHEAVAGLLDRLKPGGKMIWMTSGRTPLMKIFVGWLWRSNLYTKSELDDVLAKAGVTDVEYLSFPAPYNKTEGYTLIVEITRPLTDSSAG